jgi:hypothetical protein
MSVLTALRSLLFLIWLTTSAAAQDASLSATELTIPGLPKNAPPPSVVDTINLFRGHQELRTQLDNRLSELAAENNVDLWLVTASFQTRQSPAQEAAEIVAAWSEDRPAIVLFYLRGKHATGIAANRSLQELVPSFELARTLPPSANANATPGSDSAIGTEARVNRLIDTTNRIAELVGRYMNDGSSSADSEENATSSTAPSPRRAESLLLVAVLVAAAVIVWFTARTPCH